MELAILQRNIIVDASEPANLHYRRLCDRSTYSIAQQSSICFMPKRYNYVSHETRCSCETMRQISLKKHMQATKTHMQHLIVS